MVSETIVGAAFLGIVLWLVLMVLLLRALIIVQPYQLGVETRFGSYRGTIRPGLNFVHPLANVVRVDFRPQTRNLPSQQVLLVDGTPMVLAPRATFHVIDAPKAVFASKQYGEDTAMAIARHVAGTVSRWKPSELLADQARAASEIASAASAESARWGVEVTEIALNPSPAPISASPLPGR